MQRFCGRFWPTAVGRIIVVIISIIIIIDACCAVNFRVISKFTIDNVITVNFV